MRIHVLHSVLDAAVEDHQRAEAGNFVGVQPLALPVDNGGPFHLARKQSARLALESLEDRNLLAASVSAWVTVDGTLTVDGTSPGDAIVVREASGTVAASLPCSVPM